MTRPAAASTAALLLAACALLPVGQPQPIPAHVTRTEAAPNGLIRVTAGSPQAEPGVPYLFSLVTHCGLGVAVIDFDGSLWAVIGAGNQPNPPAGLGNPVDEGTITLTGEGTAEYRSNGGTVLPLARLPGPLDIPGCD